MIPYFILIVFPTIIWLFYDRVRFNIGNKLIYETKYLSIDAFMLILLCLLSFRGLACGNDTSQYFRLFKEYSASKLSGLLSAQNHEFGYKLLNKLVGYITDNYQIFLTITSILCICPVWYFYKKESEISLLTIALFLSVAPFFMFFSGIRQCLAMAIGIFSWYATKNKKPWLFILLVLLALQFHSSSFILFVLYPLYYAKITKKWLWFVVPCMVTVYIFRAFIFDFLLSRLWEDFGAIQETGAYTVLFLLIAFAIYSYVLVDDALLDQDTIAMRNFLLLSIIIQFFAMLHPLSMRMNYYFLIFIPILIPKIVKCCKEKYRSIGRISVYVMILFFLFYFVNMMLTDNDALNIFPYIPFWK